jgi:hypothetical protein
MENNRVKVSLTPRSILLDLLDLVLVRRLEYSVASNMILLQAELPVEADV